MGRIVTLVLVDQAGARLGALPPFAVTVPWWQEVDEVVAVPRERDGIEVQVLRLLDGVPAGDGAAGGAVRYLAQLSADLAPVLRERLSPVDVDLSAQPHRAAYAEIGGPRRSVEWAVAALADLGRPGAVAVQRRTWNLSAIWRLDVAGAPVAWLKQVPPFFGHEPAVLDLVGRLAPGLVPPVLAAGEPGRMLLGHVPGADGYGAGADVCAAMAERLHPIQAHVAARPGDLLAAGVPDRRLGAIPFAEVAEPFRGQIAGLGELIDTLPARLAAIAACGVPDTLIHGDLHPGNARIDPVESGPLVLLDWGDSAVGHPAWDILRLTGGPPTVVTLVAGEADRLLAAWAARWRSSVPGCDPLRAIELMKPVAGLIGAATFARFLANIEPAEHPYHRADVPECLARAVAAAR